MATKAFSNNDVDITVSFNNYEDISIPSLSMPIKKVSGFTVVPSEANVAELPGNFFILDMSYFNYFHFLHSQIGQYEFLKSLVPKLKLFVMAESEMLKQEHLSHRVVVDILELYKVKESDIVVYDKSGFSLESVYFYDPRSPILISADPEFFQKDIVSLSDKDFYSYTVKIVELIRDKFKSYISNESNKKTYMLDGGRDIANESSAILWAKSKKFDIVDPSVMGLYGQISMASQSKVIAGVHGASITNIFFANPGCHLIIFDPVPNYNWAYIEIAKSIGLRVSKIDCLVPGQLNLNIDRI
jgi:capsular polysaccharide biosynthesis protein